MLNKLIMLNDSLNTPSSSRGSWSSGTGLVLSRTGFIFAVAGRRHCQDPEVFLYHLSSLPGAGEGRLFRGEWVPSRQENAEGDGDTGIVIVRGVFSCESFLFLYPLSLLLLLSLFFLLSHCCLHEIVLTSTCDL